MRIGRVTQAGRRIQPDTTASPKATTAATSTRNTCIDTRMPDLLKRARIVAWRAPPEVFPPAAILVGRQGTVGIGRSEWTTPSEATSEPDGGRYRELQACRR